MAGKISIHTVNRLSREGFVERFGWRFSPGDRVMEVMVTAVDAAPEARKMALIRAHPDLAGKAAVAGELTRESTLEQSSAGLDTLTPDEYREFQRLNGAYRERFGFPLIFAVREHTKETILAGAEERLRHSRRREVETALAEISKIARLRLEDLVEPG